MKVYDITRYPVEKDSYDDLDGEIDEVDEPASDGSLWPSSPRSGSSLPLGTHRVFTPDEDDDDSDHPHQQSVVSDPELRARIRTYLLKDPTTKELVSKLSISVRRGVAIVQGRLPDFSDCEAVFDAIERVPGVVGVEDKLSTV